MNANETSVQQLSVCALANTGSSLAVPLRQGENQSTCQPSNTFRLLHHLSLATPVCVCVLSFCQPLSLHPPVGPVVLFLSVCPPFLVPRRLFLCQRDGLSLLLIYRPWRRKNDNTLHHQFCYLSISFHIPFPNYLPPFASLHHTCSLSNCLFAPFTSPSQQYVYGAAAVEFEHSWWQRLLAENY